MRGSDIIFRGAHKMNTLATCYSRTLPPSGTAGRYERLLNSIERGRLFVPIQCAVLLLTVLTGVLTGIDLSTEGAAVTAERSRHYFIKRVSTIPLNQQDQAADVSTDEKKDDTLSVEDMRQRYVNYVISKIESHKIYPDSEQKLGHEGTVGMRLYLQKSGQVSRAVVTRQARYARLTGSAVDSVRRALPFQPFPRGLPDDEIILNLNIEYYLR